jgi:GTPase SAR1 family protein
MDTQQPRPQIPKINFRVLIVGRANAGKTSILQRVCETTESPIIYRRGNEEVRGPTFLSASLIRVSLPTRLNLTRPWKLVTTVLRFGCL